MPHDALPRANQETAAETKGEVKAKSQPQKSNCKEKLNS
jgi:hypothetical protein